MRSCTVPMHKQTLAALARAQCALDHRGRGSLADVADVVARADACRSDVRRMRATARVCEDVVAETAAPTLKKALLALKLRYLAVEAGLVLKGVGPEQKCFRYFLAEIAAIAGLASDLH